MQKHYCDIRGCKEEAYQLQIDVCSGWKQSAPYSNKPETIYKPFERPTIIKKDLCEKHFKKWCKATYTAFYKIGGEKSE